MAEDLTLAPDQGPPEPPPYQSRFQLIFGVLLGIAMAAVAATVLFATGGRDPRETEGSIPWSAWKPTATDASHAIQQIAEHVGQRYTLPSGNQLVGVRGGALTFGGLPATVALDPSATASGDAKIFADENGVMYTLCGLGKNCSIKEGKKSERRHLVLRREALELALYTFHYIEGVDQVVVMMPPAPGDKPSQLMFFRRPDVRASLIRPLSATLPGPAPAIDRLDKEQQGFLARLTDRNLFMYRPQQGQDATIFLVLSPPPAG
jgi:hypothetical protein